MLSSFLAKREKKKKNCCHPSKVVSLVGLVLNQQHYCHGMLFICEVLYMQSPGSKTENSNSSILFGIIVN